MSLFPGNSSCSQNTKFWIPGARFAILNFIPMTFVSLNASLISSGKKVLFNTSSGRTISIILRHKSVKILLPCARWMPSPDFISSSLCNKLNVHIPFSPSLSNH